LAIATSVIELGRAVGLRTIAEGVETYEQLCVLRDLGCEAGQGFLWSAALDPRELTLLLQDDAQVFASAGKRRRSYSPGRLAKTPNVRRSRGTSAKTD
jgi:predicted signal transduction protein with EAL and GGDEF domain